MQEFIEMSCNKAGEQIAGFYKSSGDPTLSPCGMGCHYCKNILGRVITA